METSTPATSGPQPIRDAAAQAVTPDATTAAILAKHSAGEKLSPSEYGKLGAFKAGLKKLWGGGKTAEPQAKSDSPGNGAVVASGGVVAQPLDPRLVQRTTEAILRSADTIARRYVVNEALKAGADAKAAARFDSAAALPTGPKELMVETSPEVIAALGLDPRTYPIAAFVGALGIWGTNIWLAVDELKRLQKQNVVEKVVADRLVDRGVVTQPKVLPKPATPAGAPPNVQAK